MSAVNHRIIHWEPILDGVEAAHALEIAHDIAIAVRAELSTASPTLMGSAGIALFLAYAESAGVATGLDVESILIESLRAAGTQRLPIGLWTGCSGLRWVIDHLSDGDEASAVLAQLDAAVERALAAAPADLAFDLYSGLAGVLLAYAGDRTPAGQRIITMVLDRLCALDWARAHEIPGCAHGMAGVIAALARCVMADAEVPRARGLLAALVARVAGADHHAARACWCRGESGVALALLAAAHALEQPELEARATAMALSPFRPLRAPPADATLCHGAAGLAHICNRAYQATGNAELGARARDWLRHAMAARRPGTGVAGFRGLRRTPAPVWEADPTLLVGAAGIGLALLAGATSLTPAWDRLIAADIC